MRQIFFNYFLRSGRAPFKENRVACKGGQDSEAEKAPDSSEPNMPELGNKPLPKEMPTTGLLHEIGVTVKPDPLKAEAEKAKKEAEYKKMTKEEMKNRREEMLAMADALEKDGSPENVKQIDTLNRLERDKVRITEHIKELEAKLPSVKGEAEKKDTESRIRVAKENLASVERDLVLNDPIEMARKLREESKKFELSAEKKRVEKRQEIDKKLAAMERKNKGLERDETEKALTTNPVSKLDVYQRVLSEKVSADALKIDSHEAILNTANVFIEKLGLPENVVMWMAKQLDYVNEDAFKQLYPVGSKEYQAFTNPTLENLGLLKSKNEAFALAVEYFYTVKNNVAAINKNQFSQKKNASKSGEEPVFTFATEKAKELGHDLADAWRERDASKLAMYAVAGFGIYKFYQNFLKGSGKDEKGNTTFFGHVKKWGPILAGAYAAGWILAPEKMKDVVGLGKNIDFKGTNVEGLAMAQRNGKGSYLEKMDPAVLFNLHNANIEDIYGPITPQHSSYNEKFANNNMIPLATPGIAGYYAPDLVSQGSMGPSILEQGKNMTTKQKQYIEASQKLYDTANALREFYKDKIQPTTQVSFEDMFLNPKSPNYRRGYTMGSLYQMFQDYLPSQSRIYEANDFKQAEKDLLGEDIKTKAFKDARLTIESGRGAGEYVAANIYGYPVTLTKQDVGDGKNKYVFFLRGRQDKIEEKVEYTVGEDANYAVDKIKGNIDKRLKEYLGGVKWLGQDAASALKYEDGKWSLPVKTEKQHLIDSTEGVAHLEFAPNGDIKIKFEGKDVTILTSADLPLRDQSLIIDMFRKSGGISKSNFEALSVVSDQITIANNDPASGTFDIVVFGEVMHVTSSTGKYIISDTEQKKIISNRSFQEKYADARMQDPVYKGYIDTIRSIIDQVNTSSLTVQAKEGVRSTAVNFWEFLTTDAPIGTVFNGKIPDNYVDMTLNSQVLFLKNLMVAEMSGLTKLSELSKVESNITNRFSRVRAFESNLRSILTKKSVSPSEFKTKILNELRTLSFNSPAYADAAIGFENDVIKRIRISDVSDASLSKASRLWDVYYYYTAKLDTSDLDRSISNNPYKKQPSSQLKAKAYLVYVKQSMLLKMNEFLNSSIPANPSSWGIETFDKWEGHNVQHTAEKLRPLTENAIENEIKIACKKIVSSYRGDDYEALILTLYETYDVPNTQGGVSWFSRQASTVPTSNTTRESQAVFIASIADTFMADCKRYREAAVKDKLQAKTGAKGVIQRWLYKTMGIES